MPELVTPNEQVKSSQKEVPSHDLQSEDTAKMVSKLVAQANKATKDMRSEWSSNYSFVVNGKQWPMKRPKWRFSEVINLTWSNIMTEVGIQTDGRPKVDYSATEMSDYKFANILKEINNVNWTKPLITGHGWNRKVQTALFKCKIYDVIHAEVGWNPKLEGGIGDIDFKILDPYGCFWDPMATHIGEARWFVYAETVPTAKLKKEFPQYEDRIQPDVSLFTQPSHDGVDDHNIDLFFNRGSVSSRMESVGSDKETNRFGGEPMTMKLRCWLKDETVVEEDGNDGEKVLKLKYPKGRYIECTANCTLVDRENEYEDGLFPIATLVNYDFGEYAGENEVKHQKGPQKLVNYVLSHIMDQFKMGANPQKVVTNRAHDIVKKITNEPGLVIEVPELGDIRYEPGIGIASGSFNLLETLTGYVDKVSGIQDVARGAVQPGVTSGLMLEGFVEAAQVRPRLKNRSLDEFLRQVGYLMASRILQFYTVPRVFRITNQEGFPEYVEFFIKQDEQGNKVADITKTIAPEGQSPQQESYEASAKGIPDVIVESGSNLPYARAQKTATALDLFSKGAITLESMLDAINWPNAKEEAQKVKEEQMKAAQEAAGAQPQ